MATRINIAITGATGRMGRRLISLARASDDYLIADTLVRAGHAEIGRDAGEAIGIGPIGVKLAAEIDFSPMPNVIVDFSNPSGTRQWLEVARNRRIPILIGTTGLSVADQHAIDEAALEIPVLSATNTSMGVAVLNFVAAQMARMLGPDFDIEIVETHHRNKKDAPSGTALTLADRILEAVESSRDQLLTGRTPDRAVRSPGQIAIHAIRAGDVTGTHTVHYAGSGERLELTHVATDRDVFARGALRAASWLAAQGAGRYRIEHVLGMG